MVERLFFELMQVAVGTRSTMSRVLTNQEWKAVYACCQKQALVGMGYVAIQRLPKEQWPPVEIVLKFTAMATQIKARNELLDKTCGKVCQRLEHDGLNAVILKGQANSINYPEALRQYRMPGDIDVWVRPMDDSGIPIAMQNGKNEVEYFNYKGVRAVIEYVKMQHRINGSCDRPPMRYHHIDAPTVNGIPVEVHFRPSYKNSPIRNWRLQNWYNAQMDICAKNKCRLGFSVLTSSINVVYLMDHLFRHYFVEGVGLRQLMDYYFALRVWHNDVMECRDLQSQGMWSEGIGSPVMSALEVMAVLRSFGMGKFAGAVMWVLNEVFGGVNENDNENEKCPQMDTDGHGCPQADFEGEQQLSATGQQLKEIGPQADERRERECPRISRELKENIINPQMTQMDTDGCPQADFEGEQQLPAIRQQLKEIGPQADFIGVREFSRIDREFKKNNVCPWLLCEPNEKEGRKLLTEIMQGGNFGQYDTRDAALKRGGMMKHGLWKLKRVMRLVKSYPEEALWEPVFRVYHLFWRGING